MFKNFSIKHLAMIALLLDEMSDDSEEEVVEESEEIVTKVVEEDAKQYIKQWIQDKSEGKEKLLSINQKRKRRAKAPSKKKRSWIHPSLNDRKIEGEFFKIFPQLADDENKFYQYFCMTKSTFESILSKLEADLTKQDTIFREAISPREKLAISLRFLVTGDSYRSLATNFRLGGSTVQKIVLDVCRSINIRLRTEAFPKPKRDDWCRISDEFLEKYNFPNCLGAFGGRYIEMESPVSGDKFYVTLLALVDANRKFISVDVGEYDETGGEIFSNSEFGKALDEETLDIPDDKPLPVSAQVAPYVFLADESFPLKRNVIGPYLEKPGKTNDSKRIFNDRLFSAQKLVECTLETLVQKFKFLLRRLKLNRGNVDNMIIAACILHNIINDNTQISDCTNFTCNQTLLSLPRYEGNAPKDVLRVRDMYTTYFSEKDSVP